MKKSRRFRGLVGRDGAFTAPSRASDNDNPG